MKGQDVVYANLAGGMKQQAEADRGRDARERTPAPHIHQLDGHLRGGAGRAVLEPARPVPMRALTSSTSPAARNDPLIDAAGGRTGCQRLRRTHHERPRRTPRLRQLGRSPVRSPLLLPTSEPPCGAPPGWPQRPCPAGGPSSDIRAVELAARNPDQSRALPGHARPGGCKSAWAGGLADAARRST